MVSTNRSCGFPPCNGQDLGTQRTLADPARPGERILLPAGELGEITVEQVVRVLEPHKGLERLSPAARALEHDTLTLASDGCRAVVTPGGTSNASCDIETWPSKSAPGSSVGRALNPAM